MLQGAVLAFLVAAAPALAVAEKKGLTVDDMLAMRRIADPDVARDGSQVVFSVRETDVEANKGRFDLWILSTAGGEPRRLTTHPDNDTGPQFDPTGRIVYFLSTRGGGAQVWRIPVAGGEAEPVTRLPLDVNGFLLFPDGKRLLLAVDVYPDAKSLDDTRKRDEQREQSKVKARAYDALLFRHWDQWEDGKYSHLFVWSPDAPDKGTDLTPGQATDSPTHPFGGMEEISISPDGKAVAFIARVGGREIAWTTNTDVFIVSTDGKAGPRPLTADNQAYDSAPAFSLDGKTLAYLAMRRPGYEADRQRIVLLDVATKKKRVLTEAWDRSPDGLTWSADGKTLLTSADHLGHHALFAVDVASGNPKILVEKGTNRTPMLAKDRVLFVRDTLTLPAELFTVKPDGSDLLPLTTLNAKRSSTIAWGSYQQFSFTGAKGDTVWGYAMKPAGGAKGKAPVALLVHGGPQSSLGDHWHYRWNAQVFAGRGYGVVFIDFHGSTGYGQAFTDSINGDYGGAPYDDLMLGLDAALVKFPWLDPKRVAALGASYGGYMINWINGRTDRFRALVCHDGNIDERMAYFDTEELWFPEWQNGGPPWTRPDGYVKHNPIDLIKNWKTPTLVIHGGNDFRVVDTQGMGAFTALQRKGVPSRLLHFPDENHWVLKPQNSQRWHQEVLDWIDRFTKQ